MTYYTVSEGVFVNGDIADASDFLNEFSDIQNAFSNIDTKHKEMVSTTATECHTYTDTQLANVTIDGGTF